MQRIIIGTCGQPQLVAFRYRENRNFRKHFAVQNSCVVDQDINRAKHQAQRLFKPANCISQLTCFEAGKPDYLRLWQDRSQAAQDCSRVKNDL